MPCFTLQGAHTEPGGRAVKVQSMALLFGLLRNLRLVFALPPTPDQVLRAPICNCPALGKVPKLWSCAPMWSSYCAATSSTLELLL
jgi:hypothetical protein